MTMFESVWFQSDQKQSFNENIFLQKIMWLLAYRISNGLDLKVFQKQMLDLQF